ncbi:uncharacterized protein MKZ38_004053 [Zalerion maritima]|uniref:uridine/cytidine kinase n=1 Tax=Zalerion maritima TaxID=339359 RepID=A0AAD5WPT5_9PEZI|nr:uncharacterized protein MKZ38_004053 [Zalerion maritima]
MSSPSAPDATISTRAHYAPPWADVSIIGVAGSSGSGKSTLSQAIVRRLNLPWVIILSMDSFYKPLNAEASKKAFMNEYDFDAPDAIDFDILVERLRDLKAGRRAEIPRYSFHKHQREEETTNIYSPHVLVLEGIFALHDLRVLNLLDLKEEYDHPLLASLGGICVTDSSFISLVLRDVRERGRDIDGCIKQWFGFVKPNFEKLMDTVPLRRQPADIKAEDIILPRGIENTTAMTMVTQYIQLKLIEKSKHHRDALTLLEIEAQKEPMSEKVVLLDQTPQLKGMNTIIHDIDTPSEDFIFYFDRLTTLLIEQSLNNVQFESKATETPCGHKYMGLAAKGDVCAVVVLRGGSALERGLNRVIPDCKTGRVLIQSNLRTGEPELHYIKLPEDIGRHESVLLMDCQMSSGGAALMAVQVLADHGVAPGRIVFATYAAGRMGLHRLTKVFPDITVVTCKASSTSTTTPIKHAFEYSCSGVICQKDDINSLILDYLTMEGYSDAATKFAKEANVQSLQPQDEMEAREQIKHAIHIGNIQEAIDRLNALDHLVLEDDPTLHFALLRLQLVELIRRCDGGDIAPALEFATQHLAPRAPTKPEYLADLEKTMALLIFPHDKLEPPIAYLLEPTLRRDVAAMVNQAVNERQSRRRDGAVRDLVRMRNWVERTARGAKKDIPDKLELNLQGEDNDDAEDGLPENGHDPMVTS